MAREAPSERRPPSARLFVALELPPEQREAIVAWQAEALVSHGRALRPVRPAALHVTLVFLGHHPEGQVDLIRDAALSGVGALHAPVLQATALLPVPPRRPRLWALDLDDPGGRAAAVHEAVSQPLAAGGWYEPERRPFWPHLTVARLRPRTRAPRLEVEPPPGAFTASEVVLYRSRLSRAGADYEPLARAGLAPPS